MAVTRIQQFEVAGAIFEDEESATKYDALLTKEGVKDKILTNLENSLLPYLKGMKAGSRVVMRDWKVIASWEIAKAGYALPKESEVDWLVPKSVKDYAEEVAADTKALKPGDSTNVDPNVPPVAAAPPVARKVA